MKSLPASRIRGESLSAHTATCSRCGLPMAENHRGKRTKTALLCRDCRAADPGLAYLWRRK